MRWQQGPQMYHTNLLKPWWPQDALSFMTALPVITEEREILISCHQMRSRQEIICPHPTEGGQGPIARVPDMFTT